MVDYGQDVSPRPSSADDPIDCDNVWNGSIFCTHRTGIHNWLDVCHLGIGRKE